MITVAALYTYPIKSTVGIPLDETVLEGVGLLHDRRRALVDAATHRIMTARDHPGMLALRTAIAGDRLIVHGRDSALELPLDAPQAPISRVDLWAAEQHPAIRYGEEINRWFSRALGTECYLVAMGADCRRDLPETLPFRGEAGDAVSYADDYPVLIAAEDSLAELNGRLAAPVTMTHFRPNIVLRGGPAYVEDSWRRVRIGECEFEVAQRCPRCVMITIDPETRQKSAAQEPLRTLATYRKTESGGVPFGVQLVPRRLGAIRVGDEVEVLAG